MHVPWDEWWPDFHFTPSSGEMKKSGLSTNCGRMSLSVPCRPFCFRHIPSRGCPLRAATRLRYIPLQHLNTYSNVSLSKAASNGAMGLDVGTYTIKMRQRQAILVYTGVARATSACEPIRILSRTMKSGCKH